MSRRECPDPRPDCRQRKPYADDHHRFYPASDYNTPTERKFRQLDDNVVRGICRCVHELLQIKAPPEKPPVEEMRQAVYGHD